MGVPDTVTMDGKGYEGVDGRKAPGVRGRGLPLIVRLDSVDAD